jgi:hypothetical protein
LEAKLALLEAELEHPEAKLACLGAKLAHSDRQYLARRLVPMNAISFQSI